MPEPTRTHRRRTACLAVLLSAAILSGCGPGWDGYADQYSDPTEVVEEMPWEGDETVTVVGPEAQSQVALSDLLVRDYKGTEAVRLSDVIIQSGVEPELDGFFFNFTAADDYDLFTKRDQDVSLLPSWDEMKGGYLYRDPGDQSLTCGWTEHPWGSALSAYHVRFMEGGTITLVEDTP